MDIPVLHINGKSYDFPARPTMNDALIIESFFCDEHVDNADFIADLVSVIVQTWHNEEVTVETVLKGCMPDDCMKALLAAQEFISGKIMGKIDVINQSVTEKNA